MAKGWTPRRWNSAISSRVKSIKRMYLENEFAAISAWETRIGEKTSYDIMISGPEYNYYSYEDKNEANAKWVELKKKYF